MSERLTSDEMLLARVNTLERMVETAQHWTGLDEDWTSLSDTPAISEVVLAQGLIINQMLQLLEEKLPGFSIKTIRERMLLLHDHNKEQRAANFEGARELFEEFDARWKKIMTDLLPSSYFDEPPQPASFLTLVHSSAEDAETAPE